MTQGLNSLSRTKHVQNGSSSTVLGNNKKGLEMATALFRSPHSNTENAAGTQHVVHHIHTLYHFARLFILFDILPDNCSLCAAAECCYITPQDTVYDRFTHASSPVALTRSGIRQDMMMALLC